MNKQLRIEIDEFPGCGFPGARFTIIDGAAFDDQGQFEAAMADVYETLAIAEVNDDPHGGLIEQVREAALNLLQAQGEDSNDLVLNGGRWELDDEGFHVRDVRTGSLVIAETFDVTVSLKLEVLAQMTPAEYAEKNGTHCPFCGSSHLEGKDNVQVEAGVATQAISCADCEAEWLDTYKLTGFKQEV